MNWKLLAGAAVALFASGFAAGTCGRPTSHDLEAAHDSTKAAVARAQDAEDARAEIAIQAHAEIAVHEAAKDSALQIARGAAARRPTVVDRIVNREAPADTTVARRVALAVTDSLVEHEIRPLQAALAASDSAWAAQGRLLAATDLARSTAQEGLNRALLESHALRDARPSFIERNYVKVAIPLAAFGGWYLRGRFGR